MAKSTTSPLKWLSKLNLSRRRRHSLNLQNPSLKSYGFSAAFRKFDADGDGKISGEELLYFLSSAGERVTAREVVRVVEEFDSDGDGLIDYVDFMRLLGGGEEEKEDLYAVFETFVGEKDGGIITPEGLRRALRRLGEIASYDQCAAMIRAFDSDVDGALNYAEFCRMMA